MPAEVFHVWTYIAEECEARGWSLDRLATEMGGDSESDRLINRCTLELIIAQAEDPAAFDGLRLGSDTAGMLGRAFGVSAELFLNLDAAWRAGAAEGGTK